MLLKGAGLRSTCFFFRLIHIIASQLQVKKKDGSASKHSNERVYTK